jgi:hypothetical protein
MAILPDLEQREVTEATIFMGRSIQVITQINDVVYWIKQHPRVIVVHLEGLVPYLEDTRDKQP